MARLRKQLPAHLGAGELHCRGFTGPVDYEIQGDPATLRLGPARLRGRLTATPEVAAEAFRAGEAELKLEGGAAFRLTMLGHSAGSDVAYFEMRV
ncbi:MAG: hypothetical protein ACHP7A_01515 [Caulobacterales bacterium]|jgi:hypothetical protein